MNKLVLPLLVVTVIILWMGSAYILINDPERGTFGDMFGAVNSLFSGLAFAGLIYTILLQKNELGLQRKELELTRDELRGQKETMQAQNDQFSLQAFEGTFFQMVKLHNDLLNSIDITTDSGISAPKLSTGSDCFMKVWKRYNHSLSDDAEQSNEKLRKEQIDESYSQLWRYYEGEFAHYFRSLYNVIKFVHNSQIENKRLYTNIVRAQISGQELLIMLYNGIFFSDSKFVPLIEKYALLKHIPSRVIGSDLDFRFYDKSAFGGEYPHIQPSLKTL